MSKTSITFIVLFILALSASVVLYVSMYSSRIMLEYCKETQEYCIEEREFLTEIIPKLNPQITKKELVKVIKAKYPKEKVDELSNLVSWRFIQFWFDSNGRLESVIYGS